MHNYVIHILDMVFRFGYVHLNMHIFTNRFRVFKLSNTKHLGFQNS